MDQPHDTRANRFTENRRLHENLLRAPDDLREMLWIRMRKIMQYGSDRDSVRAANVISDFDRLELAREQLAREHGIVVDVSLKPPPDLLELQRQQLEWCGMAEPPKVEAEKP